MAINVNENGVIKDLSSIKITGFDISSIEYVGEMVEDVYTGSYSNPAATLELPDLFESYKAFILIYNGQRNYKSEFNYVTVMVAMVDAMVEKFNSPDIYYEYRMFECTNANSSNTAIPLSITRYSMGTNTIKFIRSSQYAKYKVYAVR